MTRATGFIDDFGMDTITLAGSLENKLKAMREAGFGQVMLKANDLVGHEGGVDAAVRAVKASGLRVTGFQVLRDFEGLSGHLHGYKVDIAKAKDFLNHTLRPELAKHGVGWGNRLERQIERFVPVVLEAGGSLTESVDHLVATKLVRKLEDKFGTNADRLEDLALNIELLWDLDGEYPVKTANRLRLEANRLREG